MKSLVLFLLCMCYVVAVVELLINVFEGTTGCDFICIDGNVMN